jgi:hypothetical protein
MEESDLRHEDHLGDDPATTELGSEASTRRLPLSHGRGCWWGWPPVVSKVSQGAGEEEAILLAAMDPALPADQAGQELPLVLVSQPR